MPSACLSANVGRRRSGSSLLLGRLPACIPDAERITSSAEADRADPGPARARLITEEMVASMKSGSVIVDMAAGMGGNVEPRGLQADLGQVESKPGSPRTAPRRPDGVGGPRPPGRRRPMLGHRPGSKWCGGRPSRLGSAAGTGRRLSR